LDFFRRISIAFHFSSIELTFVLPFRAVYDQYGEEGLKGVPGGGPSGPDGQFPGGVPGGFPGAGFTFTTGPGGRPGAGGGRGGGFTPTDAQKIFEAMLGGRSPFGGGGGFGGGGFGGMGGSPMDIDEDDLMGGFGGGGRPRGRAGGMPGGFPGFGGAPRSRSAE
jgi:DnaJ family protein B protein 4